MCVDIHPEVLKPYLIFTMLMRSISNLAAPSHAGCWSLRRQCGSVQPSGANYWFSDLVLWRSACNGDSAVPLKSSKSMTHEVVFYKYVSTEEHDQAKLHLLGNEWETQGVGVAGALSREWLEIVKSSILSLWWDGLLSTKVKLSFIRRWWLFVEGEVGSGQRRRLPQLPLSFGGRTCFQLDTCQGAEDHHLVMHNL